MRSEQFALPLIRLLVRRPRLGNAVFHFDRWGNIFGPDRFVDPYPIYERMRAAGPVSYSPLYQQWAILGYDEARTVLTSNSFGVESQLDVLLSTRPYSKFSEHTKALIRNVLLFADPPKHTRLRSLVNRAFTPRQIERLEPRVDKLAHELIAAMTDEPCPDVMAGFAVPLPINVISDLLGVPEERWAWAARMSDFIRDVLDPLATIDPAVVDAAFDEITDYYSGLADQRLAEPQNDVITGLVQAEEHGDRLSRDELVSFVTLLMFAGHETTTGVIGNSIVALANHPEQRALIRANPDLWDNAVEELLRFDTALHTDPRTALHDTVVGDKTIKQGQQLTIMLGGVNRDPRRYDDPNTLRLDRENPAPLSFGRGIHHCIGAALARMELKISLRAFVEAFGDYTIDPAQIQWKQSIALRGPSRLPVHRRTPM
jgi:cytochrome P450